MYSHEIAHPLQRILNKLSKKDKAIYEQILKKIDEVINSPDIEHYKNLKYNMKDKKRVHIGSFVLVFKFLKGENKIIFLDYDHHNVIYKKRYN